MQCFSFILLLVVAACAATEWDLSPPASTVMIPDSQAGGAQIYQTETKKPVYQTETKQPIILVPVQQQKVTPVTKPAEKPASKPATKSRKRGGLLGGLLGTVSNGVDDVAGGLFGF